MQAKSFTPLKSELVINREDELRHAAISMHQLVSGATVLENVLFIHGVSSIGKSTLLGEIRRRAIHLGFYTAHIDFDREAYVNDGRVDNRYDGAGGRLQLLAKLIEDLSQASNRMSSQLTFIGLSEEEAVEALLRFGREIERSREQHPFALFFDTIEDVAPETFLWLQDKVLKPFLDTFVCMIVMASRMRPDAREQGLIYPLLRRTKLFSLQPFDPISTQRQLEALGLGLDLSSIQEVNLATGGLPGLNFTAVEWLQAKKASSAAAVAKVDLLISPLLTHLVEHVILGKSGYNIPKPEQDPTTIWREIFTVAPYRQFDSVLLTALLKKLGIKAEYSNSNHKLVRTLLVEMQHKRLLETHPDGYGYVIAPDLRPILDLYWQTHYPDEHMRIIIFAAEWYQHEITKKDYVAIADRVYYLGSIRRAFELHSKLRFEEEFKIYLSVTTEQMFAELTTTLHVLNRYSDRPFDQINKIIHVFSQKEFKILFDPLTHQQLINICETLNQS